MAAISFLLKQAANSFCVKSEFLVAATCMCSGVWQWECRWSTVEDRELPRQNLCWTRHGSCWKITDIRLSTDVSS